MTWLNRRLVFIENTWRDDQLDVRLVNQKEATDASTGRGRFGPDGGSCNRSGDRLLNYSFH